MSFIKMTIYKTCRKNLIFIGLKKFYYGERVKISEKTLLINDNLISCMKAMKTYKTHQKICKREFKVIYLLNFLDIINVYNYMK